MKKKRKSNARSGRHYYNRRAEYQPTLSEHDSSDLEAWKVEFIEQVQKPKTQTYVSHATKSTTKEVDAMKVDALSHGHHKKLLGRCFNYDQTGHSHRHCPHPLKKILEERLKAIKDKYGNNTGYPSNQNNPLQLHSQRSFQNSKYQSRKPYKKR